MKVNKHTPNDDIKTKLLQNLNDPKNEKYAKKLDNLDSGHYGKAVVKAMLSAAAVLIVAVAVGIFALVGREMWLQSASAPASAPDYPNYIFVEGKFVAIAHDGIFMQPLMMGRLVSYNEILKNECLYDMGGNEIKEIYINVSELKQLNRDETQTIASRLKKYASGEYKNYYKFTLPVQFDENDMPIPIYSDNIDFAFCEDEIEIGQLQKQHKYVTAYKLDIKDPSETQVRLTLQERERLGTLIDSHVLNGQFAFLADIDGDGVDEKLTTLSDHALNDDNREYYYVVVVDGETEWIVCYDYEAMRSEAVDRHQLINAIDFDLDGKYEMVVSVENEKSKRIVAYSAREGGATEIFSVYLKQQEAGITIREFAARVANMALGMPYDEDYPSDESCEWYLRYVETEHINLDVPMSYNQIYFGIEGFAKMYNIELVGWDRQTIWEPIANLYDPTITATREKAEELLQKAKSAFENSTVSLDFTDANITKMSVNGIVMDYEDVIAQNLQVLKNVKVTDIKYIGGVTGVNNRVTLYNGGGYEVVSFSYDKGHFYINECCYTIEGTPFEDLIIIIEIGIN